MKKLLSLVLAVLMLCSAVAMFSACNAPEVEDKDVVKVVDIKLTEEEYAFAVQKGDAELLAQLNDFMTEIEGNGNKESNRHNLDTQRL